MEKRMSGGGKWAMWLSVLVVTLAVCFPLVTVAQAQQKAIKLRFASFWPGTSDQSKVEMAWCKEVEKRTNGRVKVSYFGGGVLAPSGQIYDSLEKGVFDVGSGFLTYHAGRFPLSEVLDFPLRYRDAVQSSALSNAFFRKFKPKEFDTVHMLYLHASGPSFMQSKNKMTSLKEIKGKRIKSAAVSSYMTQLLGGIPVTMSVTETYDALAKGLIDAYWGPMQVGKVFKFADHMRWMVMDHGVAYATTCWVAINKKTWDGLPKDVQAVIDKMSDEWSAKHGESHKRGDDEGREYNIKAGVTLVTVSPKEEEQTAAKMKPIFEDYIKRMKAKGLPGEEAVKFCTDYVKNYKK